MFNNVKKKTKKKPLPFIKAKDTVHLKTTRGHAIVVKKGSPYDKMSKPTGGTLLSTLRHRNLSKNNDPLAVKNYEKRMTGAK
tara:strand:+ start:310 stop:555 length:246 start_codon:yes stop_codon:yes gene_type:complete